MVQVPDPMKEKNPAGHEKQELEAFGEWYHLLAAIDLHSKTLHH
jgi:hypothetical protein